jgi:proteasome lid subunit RPN8/RPN11
MTPVVRLVIGAALVLVAVALALWFFVFSGGDDPVETPPEVGVVEPTVVPEPTLEERLSQRLEGTTLSGSDAVVRELVAGLSSRPELAEWLVNEDLIRRFVASVHNVAEGRSPRRHLEFLAPEGGFRVRETGNGATVDSRSWARYDTVAAVVGGLDVAGATALFTELEPLIDEAHREIAPPGAEFRGVLAAAMDHLLAAPIPAEPVVVEQKVVTWVHSDPALEGLSEAQRQLLRMGPTNQAVVQVKLRELKAALGL